MHNTTFALTTLALFVTPDKAAEIEGDLLEQARGNTLWFWFQLKLTCIVLFFHNLRTEPGKLLLCGYAVYELLLKFNWWVLNPVRFELRRGLDLNPVQSAWMDNFITVQVAFMMGMLFTLLSPKHGSQITFVALGFVAGRLVLESSATDPDLPRFIVFGMIPALAGTMQMKWLELRNGRPLIPYASH
jgi:hypothetical protein